MQLSLKRVGSSLVNIMTSRLRLGLKPCTAMSLEQNAAKPSVRQIEARWLLTDEHHDLQAVLGLDALHSNVLRAKRGKHECQAAQLLSKRVGFFLVNITTSRLRLDLKPCNK
jgi:hypothetical protein